MTPLGKETLLAEGQPVHVQLAGWPRTEPLTIAELSRLLRVEAAARLRRNVRFVGDDPPALKGEWVAVPAEDFDALRAALQEPTP